MKTCSMCREAKPLDAFYRCRSRKDGRQSHCRECNKVYETRRPARNWYAGTCPGERLLIRLRAHGLEVQDYALLLFRQEGKCAICGVAPKWSERRLDVDHCHASGRIRALLCKTCNLGLGHFRDEPARLRAAAAYLESHA